MTTRCPTETEGGPRPTLLRTHSLRGIVGWASAHLRGRLRIVGDSEGDVIGSERSDPRAAYPRDSSTRSLHSLGRNDKERDGPGRSDRETRAANPRVSSRVSEANRGICGIAVDSDIRNPKSEILISVSQSLAKRHTMHYIVLHEHLPHNPPRRPAFSIP